MKGVERVLLVHPQTELVNYIIWTQAVVDAAKKNSSVKAIGKVSFSFSLFLNF